MRAPQANGNSASQGASASQVNLERLMEGFTDGFVLDIGGEGRHRGAWNLNPRPQRTLGPLCGRAIPRLIRGRGESIPLSADCVDLVIVERTPLRLRSLEEIRRVIKPGGWVLLRHALAPAAHPHLLARRMLPGTVQMSIVRIGHHSLLQTKIRVDSVPGFSAGR